MIKLKKLIIKEEVDRNKLKNALKDVIEAASALSKALGDIITIFVQAHKSDARAVHNDPLFIMVNKIINIKGKINKIYAWKKHFAKLEKKLWLVNYF